MTDRPKRKTPPLSVQLDAMCIQFLGAPRSACELDHTPPLGLRAVNAAGTDYEPAQHDPTKLTMRLKAPHRAKTTGRQGTSKKGSTADGDQSKIAKAKRLERDRLAHEARRRMLAAGDADAQAAVEGRPKPKHRWPKRPFNTKGKKINA